MNDSWAIRGGHAVVNMSGMPVASPQAPMPFTLGDSAYEPSGMGTYGGLAPYTGPTPEALVPPGRAVEEATAALNADVFEAPGLPAADVRVLTERLTALRTGLGDAF